MRLLAILAFLGFIISITVHFLSLFAALIGIKLLWQDLWISLLVLGTGFLGCLIVIAGLFIAPGASKNQLWDTAFDVMPRWAKRVRNAFTLYIYLNAVILVFVLLFLLGTAGKQLKEENGKYFLQQKNGVRQELTVTEYNIRRNLGVAGLFDFPALIYFIQSIYAYSYYILSEQRSR